MGGNLNEFGVDPNMDPELAAALAASAQEAGFLPLADGTLVPPGAAGGIGIGDHHQPPGGVENPNQAQAGVTTGEDMEVDDEDALLQQAIAMSREAPEVGTGTGGGVGNGAENVGGDGDGGAGAREAGPGVTNGVGGGEMEVDDMFGSIDPELQMAMQLSMMEATLAAEREEQAKAKKKEGEKEEEEDD